MPSSWTPSNSIFETSCGDLPSFRKSPWLFHIPLGHENAWLSVSHSMPACKSNSLDRETLAAENGSPRLDSPLRLSKILRTPLSVPIDFRTPKQPSNGFPH